VRNPPPDASVVVAVLLLGGCGGSKVDFATLSTHLPKNGFGVSAQAAALIKNSAALAVRVSALINLTVFVRAIRSPSLDIVV
jgi:hypothetical protein